MNPAPPGPPRCCKCRFTLTSDRDVTCGPCYKEALRFATRAAADKARQEGYNAGYGDGKRDCLFGRPIEGAE